MSKIMDYLMSVYGDDVNFAEDGTIISSLSSEEIESNKEKYLGGIGDNNKQEESTKACL